MPTLRASNLGVVIGVVVLVTLIAAITQWLWKDASTWASTGREFLAVLAVNAAIVFVDALIGSRAGGRTPNLNTLFLVVLLSLLIALFHRYRSTRVSIASVSLPNVLRAARSPTPTT